MSNFALTTPFLIGASVIAVAAAAPLLWALLGRERPGASERDNQRGRSALAAARAAGVVSQEEYDAKIAALPPAAPSQSTPVAGLLAIVIAVSLPLSALALYHWIGEPRALDPAQHVASADAAGDAQAPDMAAALSSLEERLKANPEDAEGWSLLARGYQSAQQFDKALLAMRKVRDLMPEDLDTQVGYAEALALASPARRIDGEAAALLATTLQRDPLHQRALWLSGIAGMQRGDTATALKHWRTLETLLPEGSDIRATLAQQISAAEESAGAAGANAADTKTTSAESAPAVADNGGRVTVSISLDPKLQNQVTATDTLFVFARAASGPRMPLAIQRLTVADLPAVVTLDDSMSMMPAMKLSKFADIVIGARISKSGNATPVSGDLQALTEPMNQAAIKDRVQIIIDQVVP